MNVFGGGEASKFFKPGGFFDDKIKYDEGTKQYSFRGIKANSRFMLQMTMQNVSTNLSIHNAIYNDLMSKKSSGLELTKPEQNFVEYYLKNLEHYGLGVDANGNIIDKTE